MSAETEILQLVTNYGFPAVIAILFYVDFRKIIAKNTKVVNDLNLTVAKLCEKVK